MADRDRELETIMNGCAKKAEAKPTETVLFVAEIRVEVAAGFHAPKREDLEAYLTARLGLPEAWAHSYPAAAVPEPFRVDALEVRADHGIAGADHLPADRGQVSSATVSGGTRL